MYVLRLLMGIDVAVLRFYVLMPCQEGRAIGGACRGCSDVYPRENFMMRVSKHPYVHERAYILHTVSAQTCACAQSAHTFLRFHNTHTLLHVSITRLLLIQSHSTSLLKCWCFSYPLVMKYLKVLTWMVCL